MLSVTMNTGGAPVFVLAGAQVRGPWDSGGALYSAFVQIIIAGTVVTTFIANEKIGCTGNVGYLANPPTGDFQITLRMIANWSSGVYYYYYGQPYRTTGTNIFALGTKK